MLDAILASALLSGAAAAQDAAAAPVPLIPREVLFGNPERANVQISPDGTRITYLAPLDGVLNVWVRPIAGGEARPVTRSADRPIASYAWAWNDDQIVYLLDSGGDENTHVYSVDLATGTTKDLTPAEGARASILDLERNFPDEILVMSNERDRAAMDVVRIHLRTGDARTIVENTEGSVGYVADANWEIVGRVGMTESGGVRTEMRDSAESAWFEFAEVSMEDGANFGLAGLSRDGETAYVLDPRGRDTNALVAVDAAPGGGDRREVIFESDESDIAGVITDPETGRPQAVAINRLRTKYTILDESIRPDIEALEAVADGELNLVDRSRDDRTWVVAYTDDDGPVAYWLWDRDDRQATFLFTNRPELEDLPLAPMEALEIEARDGLLLPSYLTLPVGVEGRRLPMVLFVHGGPWARDAWGYNPYHQWLANRGYAVLSVNFRGSTGFGKAFMNAGNREWYGAMQDDLVDAVRWAVNEGIADPARVAIMGGSYGGYATLAGLTRDADLFACGVDIVGPSHVGTLLQTIPPYWEPMKVMFETRVGGLDEPEYLDSISPLTHVANIEDPLLIGQGANDPRVKVSESDQIVAAMNEASIPVTYVVFPDEGHGFAKPENRLAFNAITEIFLARHLGGRSEPLGDAVALSSAQVRELGALDLPGVTVWQGGDEPAPKPDPVVAWEDLTEAEQAQVTQVLGQLEAQIPADQMAAMLPMVIQQMEGQRGMVPAEQERLFLYLLQELKRRAAGGDGDGG